MAADAQLDGGAACVCGWRCEDDRIALWFEPRRSAAQGRVFQSTRRPRLGQNYSAGTYVGFVRGLGGKVDQDQVPCDTDTVVCQALHLSSLGNAGSGRAEW